MTALRTCRSCRETKPEDERHFSRNAGCRGGLDPTCKRCRGAQQLSRERERRAWWMSRPARDMPAVRSPELPR